MHAAVPSIKQSYMCVFDLPMPSCYPWCNDLGICSCSKHRHDRKHKRSRSRDRKRSRSRDRKRSQSKSRDRKDGRNRDRKRSKSRERKRSRSRDRKRSRSRDKKRSRSKDRKRSQSRDMIPKFHPGRPKEIHIKDPFRKRRSITKSPPRYSILLYWKFLYLLQ